MAITVTRRGPTLFAEIGGVDLTQPITPGLFAEIDRAFNEHAVLLFRDQPITDAQQVAFSEFFGPVFTATKYAWRNETARLRPEMADISNIDHTGALLAADDQRRFHSRANQLWHTDNTFKHIPARCSLLSAREIPTEGGNTQFADMRAAHDALSETRKREIDGLIVEHSIQWSRRRMGFTDFSETARDGFPPVHQVLVRRHPGTGGKALYLASHASHVVGWPEDRGRTLLDELTEFATQPAFVYEHSRREGDLIVWDNRCTMHRALPYDDINQRRVLHRTTVSDEVNSVERAAAEAA
jgi:alpha-ketoglutarate-dependent 2,4-dichlorophenoxyacetate dioxygenase